MDEVEKILRETLKEHNPSNIPHFVRLDFTLEVTFEEAFSVAMATSLMEDLQKAKISVTRFFWESSTEDAEGSFWIYLA